MSNVTSVDSHHLKTTDVCEIFSVITKQFTMANVRKNILVVDFSVLPVRPDAANIEKFLCEKIKLQLKDVAMIQFHTIRNCVLIELSDADLAKKYHDAHNMRHVVAHEGKSFKIPVYVDDDAVTVRIHDLSTDIPHTTVKKYMEDRYGVVLSIGRERWKHYFPGIPNGVRLLRMHLSKPIPSYIEIENQQTLVTYENQVKSCRFCQKEAHPKRKCSELSQETTSSSPKTALLFTQSDFPALSGAVTHNGKQTTPSVPSTTTAAIPSESHCAPKFIADADHEKEDTGSSTSNEDETNSSSQEIIETETNKRRLSTRLQKKDPKKMCIPQGCQNKEKVVTTAIKSKLRNVKK